MSMENVWVGPGQYSSNSYGFILCIPSSLCALESLADGGVNSNSSSSRLRFPDMTEGEQSK